MNGFWTRPRFETEAQRTRKTHLAFLKSKLLPNGNVFLLPFYHVQNKARRINKRLFFSCDNDGEQKMFQQPDPVNKRCLYSLKSAKKSRIFLTRIGCANLHGVYLNYLCNHLFSPWLFLRIKKIFRDIFIPTIREEYEPEQPFSSAQCCFSEEAKENKRT